MLLSSLAPIPIIAIPGQLMFLLRKFSEPAQWKLLVCHSCRIASFALRQLEFRNNLQRRMKVR